MDEHRTYWEFNSDHSRFGYMKRRIEALEREQSLLGQRVAELEARLRAENTEPIPGDVPDLRNAMIRFQVHDEVQYTTAWEPGQPVPTDEDLSWGMRMTPPEQEDDPR
jgi:hypothetical protein